MNNPDFAFCPDDRPWRIIRFCNLPGNLLAMYNREKNLLLIDKPKFDTLPKHEQRRLMRNHKSSVELPDEYAAPKAA